MTVDEERRGPTDAGQVGTVDVALHPRAVGPFVQVGGELLHVELELPRMFDQVA